MKKILKLFSPLLFLIVSLAAQAQPYERVVSLAPSLSQSLYFLGVQDKLVGCTNYCTMALKDNKEVVGSSIKVNLEKVISLKPDLVVVSGFTSPEDIEILRKFGIRVQTYKFPTSYKEICEQFVHLGKLLGKENLADSIVAESTRTIDAIKAKSKWEKRPKIFFQIGANPVFTVIPKTFMDDYIHYLGGENIAKDLTNGLIGREFVVAKNPDYIFIVTMGIVGEEEQQIWRKYRHLNATKSNQIYIIDSEIACQPTPITFAQTMEVINNLINKKQK